ncbi:MAG: hypothetical protein ACKVOK_14635 [Flavobacteriales bacterium]
MRKLLFIILTFCFSQYSMVPVLACHDPIKKTQKENNKDEEQDEPNMDGVVEVSFKIDNEGKVQIINMNSTSPQLAEYVIKKLNKIQLQQGDSQVGKIIRYRFVFKKQA